MSEKLQTSAQDTPKADEGTKAVEEVPVVESQKDVTPEVKIDAVAKEPESKTPAEQKPALPEKYELKLPEGSTLDPAHVAKVETYAKEKGLSNDQAQAILEHRHEAIASFEEAQKAEVQGKVESWKQEAPHDKEFGGAAYKENVEQAHRVLKRFCSEAFLDTLDQTGLGNHPELVRTFYRISKQMSPDQLIIPGNSGGNDRRDPAEILYGSKSE